MKIRIAITVNLDEDRVKWLLIRAKHSDHTYGDCNNPRELIRRLLTSTVEEEIAYCHERAGGE